ncbi:putative pheromone-regulated membrane protein [Neofusicoccum parvum UCRNP2]|uniref:Putative pheromone-regulated membrane protein n=1 Tax=Botryosphaeria parva (strain UCR-NP2) TaxID=1287680 RepID=R1E6W8_BOTPV|nr:putative pheromone-regulated membrane protein [Neofusicoccum parvum UCRNP2]
MNPQWDLHASAEDWHLFAEMSSQSRDGPSNGSNSPNDRPSVPQIITDGSNSPDELMAAPAAGASSSQAAPKPKSKRVGFTSAPSSNDDSPNAESSQQHLQPRPHSTYGALPSNPTSGATTPIGEGYLSPTPTRQSAPPAPEELVKAVHKAFGQPMPQKPKPAIRKTPSLRLNPFAGSNEESDEEDTPAKRSKHAALDRANRLAKSVGSASAPSSRRNSFEDKTPEAGPSRPRNSTAGPSNRNRSSYLEDLASETEEDAAALEKKRQQPDPRESTLAEAKKLVRTHTQKGGKSRTSLHAEPDHVFTRPTTPTMEQAFDDYVPQPAKYRGGIFGALLNLYGAQGGMQAGGQWSHSRQNSNTTLGSGTPTPGMTPIMTPQHSPPTSGTNTPVTAGQRRHWYARGGQHGAQQSQTSLAQLVGSSTMLASTGMHNDYDSEVAEKLKRAPRPGMGKRTRSGGAITSAMQRLSKPRLEDEIRITVHISEVMARQRYLMKLCRALMKYGAPTHRLEECMKMSARVLEIESQFLYIPGCMIISFDDSSTHTTEVKLVRETQGVDLGKLRDTHACYKDVVHDRVGVEEATQRLEGILKRPPKFKPWALVVIYGLASACVGPFAFEARLIDLPIAFLLGCLVGFLQLIAAPSSTLFNNVFEISAAVLTSFLARGFGSIRGGDVFCFSALAQSSIALILPGYIVLCASSELQSKHLVAGSVRMVYAIIYSLFLGFGMTIGIVLFGVMDKNATSATSCSNQMPTNYTFFFVPAFTMCLCIINQAKWKQMPVMVFISFAGYIVTKFSSERFQGNTQISSTLGALAIGAMANLYSRLGTKIDNFTLDLYENHLRPRYRALRRKVTGKKEELRMSYKRAEAESLPASSNASEIYVPRSRKVGYGVAAAAMLPAIFVQVPSGLAVSGSLVSGITSADQIVHNSTGTATPAATDTSSMNSAAFTVGYSVIQVAIGITVGLFLSALVIYPFGKKRSGLFSF